MRNVKDIQNDIESTNSAIDSATQAVADKQNEIDNFDKSRYYTEEMYDQDLESIYGDSVEVCGMTMNPVYILKECDPTAYRCGMNDLIDNKDNSDFEEFNELETELEELEDELSDLELELSELELELEECEDEEEDEE